MNTPGQHGLLFGERGVGKSSLANVAAPLIASFNRVNLYTKRCGKTDTFETVMKAPLSAIGIELDLQEVTKERKKYGKARAGARIGGFEGGRENATRIVYRRPDELTPGYVAEELASHPGLLLIDEADALPAAQRPKLAELIKHLSDADSPFKLLIVGIAETGSQLTDSHPSVLRCLSETRLNRMTRRELEEIVRSGADALVLSFSDDAVEAIVACSAGYPHFTHLLALKCAENSIAIESTSVDQDDVVAAMDAARIDAEGTLKESYDQATRSYATDMHTVVLVAAASLDQEEFTAAELRHSIEDVTRSEITQGALNNYLLRLVGENDGYILRRLAKGVYRFTDPRMPSFVRIANHLI